MLNSSKVSFRSTINNTTLHEHCNCSITHTSEIIVLSSVSQDESKAPEVWVRNAANTLNPWDKKLISSWRGWLTDKIISAAQVILLEFFSSMAGLQPPTLPKVFGFCPDHTCQKELLVCSVHSWLSESCCMCVCPVIMNEEVIWRCGPTIHLQAK